MSRGRWVGARGLLAGRADGVGASRGRQLTADGVGVGVVVLEGVEDRLLAALFAEAGLAVGVDALLGKVVGGAAGWER